MVSRDLVPMRERIAGPHGTGKPLQLAVDYAKGTTGGDTVVVLFGASVSPAR
jgi:hypothetical protein